MTKDPGASNMKRCCFDGIDFSEKYFGQNLLEISSALNKLFCSQLYYKTLIINVS